VDAETTDQLKILPEYRQIIAYLRKHGPTKITALSRAYCLDRGKVSDRAWHLQCLGLLVMEDRGVLMLTELGETIELRTNAERERFDNPDAGMQESQIAKSEARAMRMEARQKRKYDKLVESPEGFETCPSIEPLPDEFVEDAIAQLREHVKVGNFTALHYMADSLTEQYVAYTLESSPLRDRPLGQRLSTHLAECRDADGERINIRLVNAVELVCPATLGAIAERWPAAFYNTPNVGIEHIKTLGQVLLAADLITRTQYTMFIAGLRRTKQYKATDDGERSDD
jgi:Mn-dependent DtxR family transcriptional regulator